ncbi:MAG: energy-coupling factor ABC transporter substrate-binding protein [Leptolyngbyaceae cyanobacterium bins.59]|nr:energy-coupling factor ABC transporter substrate-binding protein [Leptolyngbyaceae cyanobacterium bins.59]
MIRKLSSSWGFVVGAIILSLGPLLVLQGQEFGATDAQNTDAIQEIQPNYQPWFKPVIQDSGPEVQTFLFAVQSGIGAGVLGYILGLYKGRSERSEQKDRP